MFSTVNKGTKDTLKDDLHRLRGDIGRAADEFRSNMDVLAHEAGLKARQALDSTSETTKTQVENVKAQIKDKPIQASLIALGVGIVLGAMLRR